MQYKLNLFFIFSVNECEIDNGSCAQICVDTPRLFKCACREGYALADNARDCNGKV